LCRLNTALGLKSGFRLPVKSKALGSILELRDNLT
jgi:hypothetical protein